MKIFYTVGRSVDKDLEQKCPCNEVYDFDSKFIKFVGSNGCKECKFCYGAKSHPDDLHKPILIPYPGKNKFKLISSYNYIKCAKIYSKIPFFIKIRCYFWNKIGIKIERKKYNIKDFILHKYYQIKLNIKNGKNKKWKK